MRLDVFLVFFLVPMCLSQEENTAQRASRTPQGHLQYNEPDGYRVSWKLYTPSTQWTSQLENPQPSETKSEQETVPEAKAAEPQEAAPVEEKQQQPQAEQSVEYKPYSMVPIHIRQLISSMYEPQGPYIDPKVYIYHTPVEAEPQDQSKSAAVQSAQYERDTDRHQESVAVKEEASPQKYTTYQEASNKDVQQRNSDGIQEQYAIQDDAKYQPGNGYLISVYQNPILLKRKAQFAYGKYPSKEVGHIEYKKENSESKPAQYGFVPQTERPAPKSEQQYGFAPQVERSAVQSEQPVVEPAQPQEKNMPSPIQQLLSLQAQTPYYVFANRITYKPKKMFIPKPIAEDDKGFYTYRSKVYYMRDEDQDQEIKQEEKPVKEVQRH